MFTQGQLKPTWFLLCFKGFYLVTILSAEAVVFNCFVFSEVELFGGR